jgi:hypothetical protein
MTMPEYDSPEYWSLYSQQSWDHYSDTIMDYDPDDEHWSEGLSSLADDEWERMLDEYQREYDERVCDRCGEKCQWLARCPADEADEDAMVDELEAKFDANDRRRILRRDVGVTGQGYRRNQRSRQAKPKR